MSSLRNSYAAVANPTRTPFVRLGTDTGVSTGESNMVGDYSDAGGGVKRFWVQPDSGRILVVSVLHIIVSDNGTPQWFEYGNLPVQLEKGIRIFLDIDGQIVYGRSVIFNNADLSTAASQESFTTYANNTRLVSYAKAYGAFSDGFRVDEGKNLIRFGLELNDDFSNLLRHQFVIDGHQQLITG